MPHPPQPDRHARGIIIRVREVGRYAIVVALSASLFGLGQAAESPVAAQPASDHLPVELYNPPPQWPEELLDTEIDPEIAVEVSIDELGRVERVQVLDITPPTGSDELIRETVVDTLSSWRYSPKRVAGEAEAATLRWSLTLSRMPVRGARDRGAEVWNRLLGRAPQRRSLLELPLERQRSLLVGHTRNAVGRLDQQTVRKLETPRFVIYSDEEEALAPVAQNAEALFNILEGMFGAAIPPVAEPLKIQIVVYRTRDAYRSFISSVTGDEVSNAGMYFGLGLIAFHLEAPTSTAAVEILLHELTHAFADRHLTRPGVRFPYWLAEGFAEYIGNSAIKDGKLIAGKVPRGFRQNLRVAGGNVYRSIAKTGGSFSLDEVRSAARKGTSLTLDEMLEADRSDFFGERLQLYYAMSWLLVHYLRHGQPTWDEAEFPHFLLYASEGFPIAAAFETAYGVAPATLEDDFRKYIKDF